MAPASKTKPQAQGPAPAPPLLECALSKDMDLAPVLPWSAAESKEHGRTLIWPSTIEKQPALKVVFPFFPHNVFIGLVPPFSPFFSAILDHYGIQALHLQPNSIWLMSIFAFYCEAFMGVRPSVALFRHFFIMRLHDDAHLLACVSFVVAESGNLLLKAGKKVENFRHRWVLMGLRGCRRRLLHGARRSSPTLGAVPILERFSCEISARRLTGGMVVKEFLVQHLAPLQAHSRPLWDYRAGDDELRLWSQDLPTEELNMAVTILLGGDRGDLHEAVGPLYRLDNRPDRITVLPVFDEWGLFPAEGSGLLEASSDDTSCGEALGKTIEDCPANVPPPLQAIVLRELEDDDATGEDSAVISSRPTMTSKGSARHAVCMRARPQRHEAELSSARPASAGGGSQVPSSQPLRWRPCRPVVAGVERRKRWHNVREDVVSLEVKKKKTGVKPKATPDAPPAPPNASQPADEEGGSQGDLCCLGRPAPGAS
ncbi:hypothetical protein D1007_21329 [Hordeum vulgare]|nr:hypothetical protein D1007_21329 [Hordeum vulgare]